MLEDILFIIPREFLCRRSRRKPYHSSVNPIYHPTPPEQFPWNFHASNLSSRVADADAYALHINQRPTPLVNFPLLVIFPNSQSPPDIDTVDQEIF